jgi:hypothetical protein
MSTQISDEDIRKLAQRRVAAKKGFFSNLFSYIVVNAMLVLLWFFVTGAGYPWFLWVMGGWGIGLIFHFFGVFVFPKEGSDWEQRQIQKEMDKIKKSQG